MGTCLSCNKETPGYRKYCQECYRKRVNELARGYYKKKTGERVCKKCGKPADKYQQYCPDCKSTRWRDNNYYQNWLKEVNDQADIKRREFIEKGDFGELEYVGGFTTGNCEITLRCKTCGAERALTIDGARSAVNGHDATLRCVVCHPDRHHPRYTQSEWFEVLRQRGAEQRAATQERKEQERLERIKERTRTVVCTVCGNTFQTIQPSQKTCSKECRKQYRNRRVDHRIPNEAIVDRDITLATLYQRDKGVCYICGCTCDWNDIEKHDGYVITGPKYPSIDHIIPVSRGGKHAWTNIRLACRGCNAKKTDNDPAEFLGTDEFIPENAEIFKRVLRGNKKMVRQSTKTGDLVGTYESTAEAARQTGFKEKQIQNCARGEKKYYRNFVWEYV